MISYKFSGVKSITLSIESNTFKSNPSLDIADSTFISLSVNSSVICILAISSKLDLAST